MAIEGGRYLWGMVGIKVPLIILQSVHGGRAIEGICSSLFDVLFDDVVVTNVPSELRDTADH